MDERAEIWIARDPDTDAQSKPVSLRKLRKGVQIGRLKPATLVQRVGAAEWVTLERLLADAETLAQTPPPPAPGLPKVVVARSERPPPPAPRPQPVAAAIAEPAAAEATEAIATADLQPIIEPAVTDVAPPVELPPEPEPAAEPPPAVEEPAWVAPPPPPGPDDSSVTAQWFTDSVPPEPGDDEPIFLQKQSVLDLGFERVMATKLVKLAYVLLLGTLSVAVLASVVHVAATIATGNGTDIATALAMVPVVILASAVAGAFGRMALEVLLALFRIADGMTFVTAAMHRQLAARRR